jgi:hypothetical protein
MNGQLTNIDKGVLVGGKRFQAIYFDPNEEKITRNSSKIASTNIKMIKKI